MVDQSRSRRKVPRVPLFAWRVKGTTWRYAFYRLDSANPFQSAIYQLVSTDTDTDKQEVVGLFTVDQYAHRVGKVIDRADCEVL